MKAFHFECLPILRILCVLGNVNTRPWLLTKTEYFFGKSHAKSVAESHHPITMNPIITHHYHIISCIKVSHDNEDYYGIIMIITSIYIYIIMGNIDFMFSRRETEKHHPITKSMFLNNQQLWACLEPCHENSINQHPKYIKLP